MFIRSGYSAQTRRTRSVDGTSEGGGGETDSGTQHHHQAADVLIRRLDHKGRFGTKAGLQALALELGDVDASELDHVTFDGGPTGGASVTAIADIGRDTPPRALDHDTPWQHPHTGRLADVEGFPDRRGLGRWTGRTVGRVERIQLGDDRAREQAAGAQMGAG